MPNECLKFLTVGTSQETGQETGQDAGKDRPGDARDIAVRQRKGGVPGLLWLGGFKSDMRGTKAQALDTWAEAHGRAGLRFEALDKGGVLLRREGGVEAFSEGGNHAFSTNSPPRMIMRSSAQISNLRPTTSMCVVERHGAPV